MKNYDINPDYYNIILQTEDSVFAANYSGDKFVVYGDKRLAAVCIFEYALKHKNEFMYSYSFSHFSFIYNKAGIIVKPRWFSSNSNDLVLEMVDNINKVIKLKAFL